MGTTMQNTEPLRASKVMALQVGARGDEIDAGGAELVSGRMRPGEVVVLHARKMRRTIEERKIAGAARFWTAVTQQRGVTALPE